MISLKLDAADHAQPNALYRHAIRLGLKTAFFLALYELVIRFLRLDYEEGYRMLKYLWLFIAIGYGTYVARKWIRPDNKANDSMVFGLVMSIFAAFGAILFDGIVSLINYHLEISDTILPIDDPFRFAVNAMATFWTFAIMGGLSTFIFVNRYKRM
ncbi:MAG: hypothetical protein KDC44_15260 [Phaeodactylibacter sp.]|nr:hypothetical protein [Phaeodactylibacter sp.]